MDLFDEPANLSSTWGVNRLRSPLPGADGRAVAFVQPSMPDEPALFYVSYAEDLVPWWPGQEWLEWLLLSFQLGALLLLVLLHFGQRWSALDLVAQCLLLSLLVHLLLLLWLMGVEIAGTLLPGLEEEDGGMQVSVVASMSVGGAAGGQRGAGVAAEVRRDVSDRALAVVAPGSETARSDVLRSPSLAVANGSYQVVPAAKAAAPPVAPAVADAEAEADKRSGVDASVVLERAPLAAVAQRELQDARVVARSDARVTASAGLVVASPASGMTRASDRPVASVAVDPAKALAPRAQPRQQVAPTLPDLADDGPVARPVAVADQADPRSDAVGTQRASSSSAASPQPVALAAPRRLPTTLAARPVAAGPGSRMARSTNPLAAPAARAPTGVARAARGMAPPAVALRQPTGGQPGAPAVVLPDGDPAVPAAPFAVEPFASPERPNDAVVRARRAVGFGAATLAVEELATPESLVRRALPEVALRRSAYRHVPARGQRQLAAVGLRESDVVVPTTIHPSATAPSQASVLAMTAVALPGAPEQSRATGLRRDRRPDSRIAVALRERLRPTPPPSRVPRAPSRPTAVASGSQAVAAESAYSNRFGPAKAKALERFGGTTETERAVQDGLRYLARVQNPDGSWGDRSDFDNKYGFVYVGKTALCVLAFLGAGHTPTSGSEHSEVVADAISHLLSVQDDESGAFGASSCYGHGIASYAIAECYGLTKEQEYGQELRAPLVDALNWILANQGPRRDQINRGGWGYFSPGLRAEDSYARVSVSSWMIMALESAQLSGIQIPEGVLPAARQYLELSFDRPNGWFRYNHQRNRLRSAWPTLPSSTPAAAFCLMLLGADASDEMVEVAADYTVERRPRRYRRYRDDDFVLRGQGNVYFWYYGSLCCFLKGGDVWQQWNARLRTILPAAQAADGSFPPIDVYADEAGDSREERSFTTAMCVLSLEVYYRYFTPLLLGR